MMNTVTKQQKYKYINNVENFRERWEIKGIYGK